MKNYNNKNRNKVSVRLIFIAILLFQGCILECFATLECRAACMGVKLEECQSVSIDFWGDSTDMHLSGERELRDAARRFRTSRSLTLNIEGKSNFSLESEDIGLRRAEVIKSFLIEEGIDSGDVKILSNGRKCQLLISRNISSGIAICKGNAEMISIDFWADRTDMQGFGERVLREAARRFRLDRSLTLNIEGKSSFSLESEDIGLRRAEAIKSLLIKESIDPQSIKILSSKGRECLLYLSH